jgi:hypothetical protein
MPNNQRRQKITLGEMRASGVRGLLMLRFPVQPLDRDLR